MQNVVKKLEVNVDIDVFLWTALSSDAFSLSLTVLDFYLHVDCTVGL